MERVHFAQFVQGVEQSGFNRSHGTAQGCGNSFQGIIRIKAQKNDLPMLDRQRLDAIPHLRGLFVELGGFIRPGIVIGHTGDFFLERIAVMPGEG